MNINSDIKIVIIDYNMGNLGSIRNMLKKLGVSALISSNIADICTADKLILPGVGTFDKGMENIHCLNIFDIINRKVLVDKTPILGICLGMQLLTESSEEGNSSGFGWIKGKTKRFNLSDPKLKIPHMGWNEVKIVDENNSLVKNLVQGTRFYFVHSYYVVPDDKSTCLLTTEYGEDFVSAISCERIYGVQFHPEKSHKYGMNLLNNFVELN